MAIIDKNICKDCKYFHEVQSSDVVFTERIEICEKLDIEWPYETSCEDFEDITEEIEDEN